MAINLRRPTEATIPDGSITGVKLANGAVDLTSDKVTGLLPNDKLGQIQDVEKLKDNLITLGKCQDDVKVDPFVGGEVEQSTTGTDEYPIVETGFGKVPGKFVPTKLRVVGSLKTSEGTGYMKIYIDDEVSARITVETTETDYDFVNGESDITDLLNGRHKIVVKIYGSEVTSVVANDYIDILFVK